MAGKGARISFHRAQAWRQCRERIFFATLKGNSFKIAIYFVSMIYSFAGPRQKKWCGNLWFICESCRHSEDYQLAMTDACWKHPKILLMSPQTALERANECILDEMRCRWTMRCVMESSSRRWSSLQIVFALSIDAMPSITSTRNNLMQFYYSCLMKNEMNVKSFPKLTNFIRRVGWNVSELVKDDFDESNFSLGLTPAREWRREL